MEAFYTKFRKWINEQQLESIEGREQLESIEGREQELAKRIEEFEKYMKHEKEELDIERQKITDYLLSKITMKELLQ
jgi:ABC-type Fe2+-enterobactin transport system substrate-binding protein